MCTSRGAGISFSIKVFRQTAIGSTEVHTAIASAATKQILNNVVSMFVKSDSANDQIPK